MVHLIYFKLEIPFMGKFGSKNQSCLFKLKLALRLIPICKIQWLFHFFRFRQQVPFLGKFGRKNHNCQFILKFGTWTNSNMQSSMAMFNFSAFDWNYPFWANLVPNNQNCPFKLKFDPKYLFWAYLVQNFKFVCSGKISLPRLIRICRTQWRCS